MGKVTYGLLFIVILPLLLALWANEQVVIQRNLYNELYGTLAAITGLLVMALGVNRLITEGKGLPMNLYPPPEAAKGGIYHLVPHPIYTGAVFVSSGLSIAIGSSSGLWLVTPLLVLGCAALVFGYERPDCIKRFSKENLPLPLMGLPPESDQPLLFSRRFAVTVSAMTLWVISYMGIKALGSPPVMIETRMPWEWSLPVLSQTMPVYDSVYILVPLSFLLPAPSKLIRKLFIKLWIIIAVVTIIYLTLPFTAEFRSIDGRSFFDRWLLHEQALSSPAVASFPSFHVIWAFLWAEAMQERKKSFIWWLWAILVSGTCLTTGMHSLMDVISGFTIWVLLRNPSTIWKRLLLISEYFANSWSSIRIGPLRIINHGVWPSLGSLIGLMGIFILSGPGNIKWMMIIGVSGLAVSGLWAQLIEGSNALSRPFGYYGFFLGVIVGIIIVALLNGPWSLLAASLATVAPFVQAIGRIRCLIQGCCHGSESSSGIKVLNPHSRVTLLSNLKGKTIHPTQLYSILGNIPIGILLLRLWSLNADFLFITGLYCILTGFARFAEEAYRGEPQTIRIKGLPLYQWTAVFQSIAGFLISAFQGGTPPALSGPTMEMFLFSLVYALLILFSMGMDFPESSKRFSRLSG